MKVASASKWLASGDTCPASKSLFTYCSGIDILGDEPDAFPKTVEEFRSCRLLLEACPEIKCKMRRIGYVSKEWAELVSFWDDLCMIHDLEVPDWRSGHKSARRTKKMLVIILTRVNPELFQDQI